MQLRFAQRKKIPIIICIDVEPDGRAIDPLVRKNWFGFEETWNRLNRLRHSLAKARGPVHFSWFLRMDPQVKQMYGTADWVFSRYPGQFVEMQKAGDEIGL